MKALVAAPAARDGLELRDVAEPSPQSNEVIVEVKAVSLNRGEIRRLRKAEDGWKPGWDLSGVVVRAAEGGGGPRSGARVVGLLREGAWAERVAVPVTHLATIPDGVSFAAAATLPVAGLTALRVLSRLPTLAGRRVLITGAAGGVGRYALQLGSQAGALMTAVVGSPSRMEGLRKLGADRIVVAWPDRADEKLRSEQFDLIMESVGGASLAAALAQVAAHGVVVSIGNSSGTQTLFDVINFYQKHGASLQAFRVFEEIEEVGGATEGLDLLARRLQAGSLRPEISREMNWLEAAAGCDLVMKRMVPGKVVLHIN